MVTLHMMVGLPCSGKTTLAKWMEAEQGALRLTADEWHLYIYGQDAMHPDHDERHRKIEQLQWQVAANALRLGLDVILDFGFWRADERESFRRRAAALGAASEIHYVDVPHEQLLARLQDRNERQAAGEMLLPAHKLMQWIPQFQPPSDAERLRREPGMAGPE